MTSARGSRSSHNTGTRGVYVSDASASASATPTNRFAARSELSNIFHWNPNYQPTANKRRGYIIGKRSKKKRLQTWTHTWVCLARRGDQQTPDAQERSTLKLADLGEKRFPISLFADAQEIHTELLEQFPKLVTIHAN